MPGNSNRRGAVRKRAAGNPTAGSGGRVRQGLEGKGPTPRAEDRPNHKKYKFAKKAAAVKARRPRSSGGGGQGGRDGDKPEWIVGRNPVVEAMRAGIPVMAVHMAERTERDDRLREVIRRAGELNVPLLEVSRGELDRITSEAVHQGLAIQVPAYGYADPADLLDRAAKLDQPPLLMALDGVTDPRNLGAVIRSAAAFGAHGVVIPERRSASMTAAAWKVSAGAALRVPVARATNLTRALKAYQKAGLTVVGLAADGAGELADLGPDVLSEPLVLVLGSEGKGLGRLVGETCDHLARIPMTSGIESLNAGVAAGIALYEAARHR